MGFEVEVLGRRAQELILEKPGLPIYSVKVQEDSFVLDQNLESVRQPYEGAFFENLRHLAPWGLF